MVLPLDTPIIDAPRELSGFTTIVSKSLTPGRRTSIGTPFSGSISPSEMAVCRSRNWVISLPAIFSIRSPTRMSACQAGSPKKTAPTTQGICSTPKKNAVTAIRKAKIMFIITPAEMIAMR